MTGDGRKCQVNLALRGRAGRAPGRAAPGPDLLAFTELAARLLKAAAEAAGETGDPEDPPTWSAWQLLAPRAAVVLNSLSALPDSSDETIGAVADAAYMAARYRASQGSYAAAAAEYGEVFTARLRGLAPDHPSTKASTRQRPPSCGCSATTMRRHWKLLITDSYFAPGRGFRSPTWGAGRLTQSWR
jgi:hypothetical protein